MKSPNERPWLLPAFGILGLMGLLFIGGKLNSSANTQAELQTSAEDAILVIPVQFEHTLQWWIPPPRHFGPISSKEQKFLKMFWQIYER